MSNSIIINKSMKKLLKSKSLLVCFPINKKRILDEIDVFFEDVKMHERYGQKCFSVENIFESDLFFKNKNLSVVEWEWNKNEIYLDKPLIKRQYKKVVILSSKYIEKALLEKFPNNAFVISFCIQFGKYRNINIRICQASYNSILDEDLDKYEQPVMQIYLMT